MKNGQRIIEIGKIFKHFSKYLPAVFGGGHLEFIFEISVKLRSIFISQIGSNPGYGKLRRR